MSDSAYIGGELELFAKAKHWKAYWSTSIRPWLRGRVLEVGAGIGTNTTFLRSEATPSWTCLEPDPALVETLRQRLTSDGGEERLPQGVQICTGDISTLPPASRFDTILYIDVLEHIAGDAQELARAATFLDSGGRVIVLAPAHNWLFSPFDAAIGHHRRYTTKSLLSLTPTALRPLRAFYLDAVGLLASAANRLMLRQSLPTAGQLRVWDNWMIPASRLLDPLTFHRIGKTAICIWERNP